MKVANRRLKHNFQVLEKVEVGISLTGSEVKSIREGRVNLDEAFVGIRGGEAWLYNTNIPPYGPARGGQVEAGRPRKLLLHKDEILAIEQKVRQKRLTIVPVACYTRGRNIKLEIALAKGKKRFEKRQALKEKDIKREIQREIKSKI